MQIEVYVLEFTPSIWNTLVGFYLLMHALWLFNEIFIQKQFKKSQGAFC